MCQCRRRCMELMNRPGISCIFLKPWHGGRMSRVPAWFERKFEFSFPVEFYPNLATRLRGTPARLEEILRGRSHEILVKKEPGNWSAQEHAGHLLDLELLWITR